MSTSPDTWPQTQAILRALDFGGEPSAFIRQLVGRACLRLIDTDMVIAGPAGLAPAKPARGAIPIDLTSLAAVDRVVDAVGREGFGPWAEAFFSSLGEVFVTLSGDSRQQASIRDWASAGLSGAFCMTDRGGPLLKDWRSRWTDGEIPSLVVDKQWTMNVKPDGFGIVLVRRGMSLGPAVALVPPDAWRDLVMSPCGAPFLEGRLPLHNLAGHVAAEHHWLMAKGGPAAAKAFLSIARPRLVRALCGHVRWLQKAGRVVLEAETDAALDRLEFLAETLAVRRELSATSEDEVMALKFLANELWLDLITRGGVREEDDMRDLMAFTKMEGSSYRCMIEIVRRNQATRHVQA